MERSLRKSGRDATFLLSVPDNTSHAHTANGRMPEMVERALRLLCSLSLLSQGRSKSQPLSVAKLAIGGYSESGEWVAPALESNVKQAPPSGGAPAAATSPVTEVYIFDTRAVTFASDKWEAWLKIPGVRLRVTRFAGSPADVLVKLAQTNGLDKSGMLTVWVSSIGTWRSEIDGNPWWRYVMQDTLPYGGKHPLKADKGWTLWWQYGHQFMVLGGRGDRTKNETFLWEFLRDSDL
jgi:hypothetical protein